MLFCNDKTSQRYLVNLLVEHPSDAKIGHSCIKKPNTSFQNSYQRPGCQVCQVQPAALVQEAHRPERFLHGSPKRLVAHRLLHLGGYQGTWEGTGAKSGRVAEVTIIRPMNFDNDISIFYLLDISGNALTSDLSQLIHTTVIRWHP